MVAVALQALKHVVAHHKRNCGHWAGGHLAQSLAPEQREKALGADQYVGGSQRFAHCWRAKADQELVRRCYQKTGCMVHAMYPAYKYYHWRTDPETAGKARFVASQVEYLYHVLTGERAVSRCTASERVCLISTPRLGRGAAAVCRPQQGAVGRARGGVPRGSLKASIAQAVGLKPGTPVTVGAADGAMNQLAIGGADHGIMSFSVGTSGAMRMVVDAPGFPNSHPHGATICTEQRLVGAATNGATNCVDWFLTAAGIAQTAMQIMTSCRNCGRGSGTDLCPSSTVNAVQVGRRTGQRFCD